MRQSVPLRIMCLVTANLIGIFFVTGFIPSSLSGMSSLSVALYAYAFIFEYVLTSTTLPLLPRVIRHISLYIVGQTQVSYVSFKRRRTVSSLFAHHPQKKIIKRKMDERPKKKRPSDIHRNNANLNKGIHDFDRETPEYTIVKPEDVEEALKLGAYDWQHGDSTAEWIPITDEDRKFEGQIPTNVEPWAPGDTDTRRNLPLVKLNKGGTNHFYGKDVIDLDIMTHLEELERQKMEGQQHKPSTSSSSPTIPASSR